MRTSCIGTEIYWHGILDYSGRNNIRLSEITSITQKVKKIEALAGTHYKAAFGILSDYDNEFDYRVDRWHERIQNQSMIELFTASQLYHIPCDIVDFRETTSLITLAHYPVLSTLMPSF